LSCDQSPTCQDHADRSKSPKTTVLPMHDARRTTHHSMLARFQGTKTRLQGTPTHQLRRYAEAAFSILFLSTLLPLTPQSVRPPSHCTLSRWIRSDQSSLPVSAGPDPLESPEGYRTLLLTPFPLVESRHTHAHALTSRTHLTHSPHALTNMRSNRHGAQVGGYVQRATNARQFGHEKMTGRHGRAAKVQRVDGA
jgi:hypothetical protein